MSTDLQVNVSERRFAGVPWLIVRARRREAFLQAPSDARALLEVERE